MMLARFIGRFAAFALLATPALAAPVYIEAGDSRGRGLAEMRGQECLVLVPEHVTAGERSVTVVGNGGARGTATYLKRVGEANSDLMMFRVDTNEESICSTAEAAMLKAMPGAMMVLRSETGSLELEPLAVANQTERLVALNLVNPEGRAERGISGGLVLVDGRPTGMILQLLEDGSDADILAANLRYVAALEGPWILGPAQDVSRIRESLAMLQSIIAVRPSGDMGQIAAIEDLVRNGSPLSGADLDGIGLQSLVAPDGNFSRTYFEGAYLDGAILARANISEAFFSFAEMRNVDMKNVAAQHSRFYFADADGTSFANADLRESNFSGISARSADFSGADLRGATFLFADLTGANFAGADLRGTYFVGSIVEGAGFEDAKTEATDFSAAVGGNVAFTDAQLRGMCASDYSGRGMRMTLMRTVPSTRFESGRAYDDLVERGMYLPPTLAAFPECPARELRPAGLQPVNEYPAGRLSIAGSFRIDFEAEKHDEIGLRRRYARRFDDALNRVQDAWTAGPMLKTPHARAEEIRAQLTERLNNVAYKGTPSLNDHRVLFALSVDRQPGWFPERQWLWYAERWLDEEKRLDQNNGNAADPWPRFYPTDLRPSEMTAEVADLYRLWSIARGDALPETFDITIPVRRTVRVDTVTGPLPIMTLLGLTGTAEDPTLLGQNVHMVELSFEKPVEDYVIRIDDDAGFDLGYVTEIVLQGQLLDFSVDAGEPDTVNDQKYRVRIDPERIRILRRQGIAKRFGLTSE